MFDDISILKPKSLKALIIFLLYTRAIIKQVPKAVNLRIRNLSVNEEIFRKSSKMYIDALKSSGYEENFTYKEETVTNGNNK